MKKVLIISPSSEEQKLVEEVAKNHERGGEFDFFSTSSFAQDLAWWEKTSVDLLIMRLPDDDPLQAAFFMRLKKEVPGHLPLILMTAHVSQALLKLSSVFKKIRYLKTPIDGFLLYRAILDITTDWAPGKQQMHPRYSTDHLVQVCMHGQSKRVKAVLRNISVGGAFFESEDRSLGLKPTDLISIMIPLPNSDPYEFGARIVWSKPVDDSKVVGYGCTFTDMDEVYRNLLRGF